MARLTGAESRRRQLRNQLLGEIRAEQAEQERQARDRMKRPEGGWPAVDAGDVFVFDASGMSESESFRFAGAGRSKFAIVICTPHPMSDHVEVVMADSFKADRADHVEALDCGTHVAIEGSVNGGPVLKMPARALVDCTVPWALHRHRFGRTQRKLKKRHKGNVGSDLADRIIAARTNVMHGRADLDRFHDAVARRRIELD